LLTTAVDGTLLGLIVLYHVEGQNWILDTRMFYNNSKKKKKKNWILECARKEDMGEVGLEGSATCWCTLFDVEDGSEMWKHHAHCSSELASTGIH